MSWAAHSPLKRSEPHSSRRASVGCTARPRRAGPIADSRPPGNITPTTLGRITCALPPIVPPGPSHSNAEAIASRTAMAAPSCARPSEDFRYNATRIRTERGTDPDLAPAPRNSERRLPVDAGRGREQHAGSAGHDGTERTINISDMNQEREVATCAMGLLLVSVA
jgi:hypothetical protein